MKRMKQTYSLAWLIPGIFKKAGTVLFILLPVAFAFLISCEDESDDAETGDPYFTIEGNPTGLPVTSTSKTQAYVVRSNRPWQVVAQSEESWAKAFPAEGEDDGIFKFIVEENAAFSPRTMNFAFVVDGKEQPVLFRIDQEANVPYITVTEATTGISVPKLGGTVNVNIKANVDWTYTLENGSWLIETEKSATTLAFSTGRNFGEERKAILTITSSLYPALIQKVTITQSAGNILFEEYFSWLNYGNAVFYTTSGETRYDAWTSEEKAKGWTSTVNTAEGSGSTPLCYARPGFVKLGKTSYGGDLISPKLSEIVGTVNIQVSFKAVPYMTSGGTKDDNTLVISVIGPGSVSTSSFTIDNWPNYTVDPACTAIWIAPATTRTFTITGAASETQIKFLGGDYALKGVGAGKNRIFLDDIVVKQIN